MWKYLLGRLREPSTYAGLAGLTYAVGTLGKINEAPAVADAINATGQAVAGGMDPLTAAIMGAASAAAIFVKDRGAAR